MLWSNISEIKGRCKEDSFNQLWRNATGRFTWRCGANFKFNRLIHCWGNKT